MARDSKIEVGAANIRIPKTANRDYVALFEALLATRTKVNVYGDNYLVITSFDPEERIGVFSKYTEIDSSGDWLNTERLNKAQPDELGKISIPRDLKPNLSQFYFQLHEELHIIVFETYSESKGLSLKAVQTYLNKALSHGSIVDTYGNVVSTIVNDHPNATELLNLPDLKEIRVLIKRPNSDDIGEDLAHIIEQRMLEQNGDEYEEVIRAKGSSVLEPNERTHQLGIIAADNGDLAVKSLVNGVVVPQHARKTPLIEVEKYKSDESAVLVFGRLVDRVVKHIRAARRRASGQN